MAGDYSRPYCTKALLDPFGVKREFLPLGSDAEARALVQTWYPGRERCFTRSISRAHPDSPLPRN